MSHPPDENLRRIGGTATVAVRRLPLAGFAARSWSAARTKCPTLDQPLNTGWAWHLAGPIASIVALAFLALDPIFLGPASLVKNAVALAFSALLLMYALWRLGREVTPGRALVAALAFAAGFGVKFSALLFLPLAALILIARAILPVPWLFFGRSLAPRGTQLLAGALHLVR